MKIILDTTIHQKEYMIKLNKEYKKKLIKTFKKQGIINDRVKLGELSSLLKQVGWNCNAEQSIERTDASGTQSNHQLIAWQTHRG